MRDRVRSFIEELIESELATVLARPRYGRRAQDGGGGANSGGVAGHRHGSRTRTLTGTFGRTEIAVPRARLMQPDGGTTEWKSQALRAYQRRTRAAEALIAGAYLAGRTRRPRRPPRSTTTRCLAVPFPSLLRLLRSQSRPNATGLGNRWC